MKLTFACGLYDRMVPLYTGEVKPEGIDLDFQVIDAPRVIFDRLAGSDDFDVAEFSSTEYISRIAANDCPFAALPVFPSRVFRHGFITINERSGIREPKDLAGKRIGVPLYTMSAALWIRGTLENDYGVDLSGVKWLQGSINSPGAHGDPHVLPMARPPRHIEDNHTGKSLSQLIDEGAIDAIIGTSLPESRRHNPAIRRLFPDYRRVEQDYYRRTRIFPIMHLVVMRKAVYEKHPFIAQSLYDAFCASRRKALAVMMSGVSLRYMLPWMTADIDEIEEYFGGDPWPYGVEANRPTLQASLDYLLQQSIIDRPVAIEELFVKVKGE